MIMTCLHADFQYVAICGGAGLQELCDEVSLTLYLTLACSFPPSLPPSISRPHNSTHLHIYPNMLCKITQTL